MLQILLLSALVWVGITFTIAFVFIPPNMMFMMDDCKKIAEIKARLSRPGWACFIFATTVWGFGFLLFAPVAIALRIWLGPRQHVSLFNH